ncbi:MAG: hypothetical protein OEW11_04545 [Nitrospirota bacterium]|nr:hypothetical protein [Nitrospirota bacterium]
MLDGDFTVLVNAPVLLLLLPGLWLGALSIARRVVQRPEPTRLVAVGLALCAWLLGIHVAGLVLHSFHLGLWVGTLVAGIGGYTVWFRNRTWVPPLTDSAVVADPLFGKWVWRGAWASTVMVGVLVGMCGWGYDQETVTGHMSEIAQIKNGEYPPRFIQFPQFEYRYHYGVDVLCAAVSSLLWTPVDITIDIVTVLGWWYFWLLLSATGAAMLGGKRRAPLLPVMILFSGGTQPFLYLFARVVTSVSEHSWVELSEKAQGGGGGLVFHHFFQPPFMMGMILVFGLLVLTLYRHREVRSGYFLVAGMIFLTLGFSNVVLFATVLGAWCAQMGLEAWKYDRRRAVPWVVGLLVGVVLLVSQMHGFFAPAYSPRDGFPLVVNRTIDDFRVVGTNLVMWLGVVFPVLGIVGLCLNRSLRAFWLLLASGSLAVWFLWRYPHSWDIAKFTVVACIALGVGVAVFLVRLLQSGYRWRIPVAVAIVGACVLPTASTVIAALYTNHSLSYSRPMVLTGDHIQAVAWMRANVPPGQLVLMAPDMSLWYSIWGGIGTVWDDNAVLHGVPREILDKRAAFLKYPSSNPGDFLAEGIHWVVVSEKNDRRTKTLVSQWEQAGRAHEAYASNQLRVYEITSAGE